MTMFEAILRFFVECKIALADKFAPPYIASLCCHLLNMENQKREFHFEQGRVANMRVHVYFVAPPGFFKTLMLTKLCDGPFSILGESVLQAGFEGSMTEAGLTGTFRMESGEFKEHRGAAWDHREGILAIDEFSALTNMMKQEHSMNLESSLLTCLDSGYVAKRLAAGKIEYMSQMSLWTGSQPLKFNLSSGLGRRFFFVYFIPTLSEIKLIRQMRREGKNILPPKELLFHINNLVKQAAEYAKAIQDIEYCGSLYNLMDKYEIPHYEEALYERIAAGITLALLQEPTKILKVEANDQIAKIFELESAWRSEIKAGADTSQVYIVCCQMAGAPTSTIKHHLTSMMGLDYNEATRQMEILYRQGRIVYKPAQGERGRKVKLVFPTD